MAKKKGKSQKRTKKIYQIEMTSSSMFFWGFCLFFLLAWIFVLGIFVGLGFLPGGIHALSDLKTRVSKLQGIVTSENSAQSAPQKKEDVDPELAFYKRLSSENEGVVKKQVRTSPEKSSSREQLVQGQGKVKAEGGISSVALRERRRGKSAGIGKPGQAAEKTYYTVQLASLGERGKAENMIKKLGTRGYEAYCYETELRGRTYYRVRSGRFNTRKQAVDHARRLAKETGLKGFVWKVE